MEKETLKDAVLFCPECGTQHIDKAKPDVCESCGHHQKHHFSVCNRPDCKCGDFTAWLNPPHKKHRCAVCNHVWKPFDYPTNGVKDQPLESEFVRSI
jgi:hypothetical protein